MPAQHDGALLEVIHSRRFLVGMDPSFPPFEAPGQSGQPLGFDVDLAHMLATRLFATIELTIVGLDGYFDALRARKVHVVISSIVPTLHAGRDITFSSPYYNAGLVLCVPATKPGRSLLDFAKLPVGVELGSEASEYMTSTQGKQSGARMVAFDDIKTAIASLDAGDVAAVVTDRPTASILRHSHPGFRIVDAPLTNVPYAVALRSRDQTLLGAINYQLKQMRDSGDLDVLSRRWL